VEVFDPALVVGRDQLHESGLALRRAAVFATLERRELFALNVRGGEVGAVVLRAYRLARVRVVLDGARRVELLSVVEALLHGLGEDVDMT
jgi:hypothetical protein